MTMLKKNTEILEGPTSKWRAGFSLTVFLSVTFQNYLLANICIFT